MNPTQQDFASFKEFYPFYLTEHQNSTCRRLHFLGSSLVLATLFTIIKAKAWSYLWVLPLIGYGFAWVGHFFFEHNKPATFKYPLYSFAGDWVMFKDMILGKVKW